MLLIKIFIVFLRIVLLFILGRNIVIRSIGVKILVFKKRVVFDVVDFLDCVFFKILLYRVIFYLFRLGLSIFLGVIYFLFFNDK